MTAEVSIIVPTLNEKENVVPLIKCIKEALAETHLEIIFVDDDSDDGTADFVRQIASKDQSIRCIQRIGRRGLTSACIEGMLSSSAPYLAVMDADLQHDVRLLPKMLDALKEEDLHIVVASRYVEGGDIAGFSAIRHFISRFATLISRLAAKAPLKDPMSGFFMLKRDFFQKTVRGMSAKGFKILLDLFASAPHKVKVKEIPYTFRTRQRGQSKLDTLVVWEYFALIADKIIGKYIPVYFVMFMTMGFIGAIFHVAVLGLFFNICKFSFLISQATATFSAMSINFTLNNIFTYRDKRLKGWKIIWGWVSFMFFCSLGALVNLFIAQYLYLQNVPWWIAGTIGTTVGGVFNYATTNRFTWEIFKNNG